MSSKIKILAILQAVFAFIIIFALNYFALNMSLALSFLGAFGFTLLMGGWAGYRYNRYLKKQQAKRDKENLSHESNNDRNKK